MADELRLPLDSHVTERLHRLGGELLRDEERRKAFIGDREKVLKDFDLEGELDLGKLDEHVLGMLADPDFNDAIETRDIAKIRGFVQERLRGRPAEEIAGTFDFDFDVEVEVEVVVIAIAVFDFAAAKTRVPNEVELQRRRALVADALERVGQQSAG